MPWCWTRSTCPRLRRRYSPRRPLSGERRKPRCEVKTSRWLWMLAVLLLAAALGYRYVLPLWRARRANVRELGLALPAMPPPGRADRVLVLAPHCDDETLGTGGMIALARASGSEVRVVLVTNGDGFHYGAERLFEEVDVPPADYMRMAADRQRESLSALSELGLPGDSVVFLGYPDGGTASMWQQYWEAAHPYTSPHTDRSHNPYANSLRPGAPYCGRSVIDDLKRIIREFRPTTIFCPHPNDNHPDHWALYCYATAALYELGELDAVPLQLYLVHRGDWPVPQGLHLGDALAPPASLSELDTQWATLPFGEKAAERKHQAILRYRSQVLVMRRFLLTFARTNELFGQMQRGPLPVLSEGRLQVDGDPSDWHDLSPVVRDPSGDLGSVDIDRAGDVTDVYAARVGERLLVRIDLAGDVSGHLRYTVHLHPLGQHTVGPPVSYAVEPGRKAAPTESRHRGRCLELSVPMAAEVGAGGLMLGVDSSYGRHVLDKTAWVLIRPEGPSPPRPTEERPAKD
jgi:LmbE family N-acetylglucosaminyl deacetylase